MCATRGLSSDSVLAVNAGQGEKGQALFEKVPEAYIRTLRKADRRTDLRSSLIDPS